MNLREMANTYLGLHVDTQQSTKHEFKLKDQVVIYRPVGFSGSTKEVIVGNILAEAGKGKYVVSIPRPGGVTTRATVLASQLKPVTDVFRRSSVQINPAFRGQM
jgi:hypothetical protein